MTEPNEERSQEWIDKVYGDEDLLDGCVLTDKDGNVVHVGKNVGRMPDGSLYEKPPGVDFPAMEGMLDASQFPADMTTEDVANGKDYYDPVVRDSKPAG